jgi:hypothetical protein
MKETHPYKANTEARAVCVLFLLISRKFNTLFPCHFGNMKLSPMGAGLLPDKEQHFFPTSS